MGVKEQRATCACALGRFALQVAAWSALGVALSACNLDFHDLLGTYEFPVSIDGQVGSLPGPTMPLPEGDAGVPMDAGSNSDAEPDHELPDGSLLPAPGEGFAGAEADANVDAGGEARAPYLEFVPLTLEQAPAEITSFEFIPGREEFLLLTRPGVVHHYALQGDSAVLLGSFRAPFVHDALECGLISIAFDPAFAENGFFYLGHCFSLTHSGISRLRFDATDYEAIPGTAVEILRVGDAEAERPWHNIGQIGFDADGHLWALVGEQGLPEQAQDRSTPLGAVLRIDPSRAPGVGGYTAVADNPHARDPAFHPDVYAYGLRLPRTGTLDAHGRYIIGDVGGFWWEEINLVSKAGQNFGSPLLEGPCWSNCGRSSFVNPLIAWDRSIQHTFIDEDPYATHDGERAAWVGPFYEPPSPELDPYGGYLTGRVLFGDTHLGFVRLLEVNGSGQVSLNVPIGHIAGASAWDIGPDGHLYAAGSAHSSTNSDARPSNGALYRAVLTESLRGFNFPPGDFPARLSEFGILPRAPDPNIIPRQYAPRWPLLSDGLGKLRHVVVPQGGAEISREADAYVFPEGTLFFETFTTAERPIETRVMHLLDGVWRYAAYRWNTERTDATLLDMLKPVPIELTMLGLRSTHEIPSLTQCKGCHEAGARQVLGFTPLQLGDAAE